MDAQSNLFSLKSRTFELGQTNWVDKFWRIGGIFGTHFDTVSPLSIFSIIQPLFLQKIYIHLGLGFNFEFEPQRITLAIECP